MLIGHEGGCYCFDTPRDVSLLHTCSALAPSTVVVASGQLMYTGTIQSRRLCLSTPATGATYQRKEARGVHTGKEP